VLLETLDFDRPVALILAAVLHFLPLESGVASHLRDTRGSPSWPSTAWN
jgi:hypothetical protein